MNTLIQFLSSTDPLILYAIGMTCVALALILEVSLNTVHDKSDYPSNPTTSNEESTDGNSSL